MEDIEIKKAFFRPWVNKELYKKGINGKNVLVLGASFYCAHNGEKDKLCKYYEECAVKHHTRETCPFVDYSLHDLPSYEPSEENTSYCNFYHFFSKYLETRFNEKNIDFDSLWDKIAFTNYVQHQKDDLKTYNSDCYPEYIEMFEEALNSLDPIPDIVITWGAVVDKPIKGMKESKVHFGFCNTFDGTNHYVFKWENYGEKDITFLCIIHPSAPGFSSQSEKDYVYGLMDELFDVKSK